MIETCSPNLVSMCWFTTATSVRASKSFTRAALGTLVRCNFCMLISKVLTLTSDWLGAILWNIQVASAFTAADFTWHWNRSGLGQCLVICLVLFVPLIEKAMVSCKIILFDSNRGSLAVVTDFLFNLLPWWLREKATPALAVFQLIFFGKGSCNFSGGVTQSIVLWFIRVP